MFQLGKSSAACLELPPNISEHVTPTASAPPGDRTTAQTNSIITEQLSYLYLLQ